MDGMSVVQPFFCSNVMGSSSLRMFVFVVVYDLYTAKYDLHFINWLNVNLVF